MSRITIEEFRAIMRESLPFAVSMGAKVVALAPRHARFRMAVRSDFLRPGGRVKLAVTTNLTINFLRKPPPADLVAEARLLKLGKRLAVGEVELFTEGDPDLVAHAVRSAATMVSD